MGEFEFRPKTKGNLAEGGIVRAKGEEEEYVGKKTERLSEETPEQRRAAEVRDKEELDSLAKLLEKRGLYAGKILHNQDLKEELFKKLPSGFRYGKLSGHLETLAGMERAKFYGGGGN